MARNHIVRRGEPLRKTGQGWDPMHFEFCSGY